ncbi:hypothetical protein ACMXYW_04645 [Neptuniibacter sp. QD48_55]|uniref:hypothetical protein n=1 Tax=Neptuniibacter sp. QD48_55 TaxID=3398212 RepID=UPI0039F4C301
MAIQDSDSERRNFMVTSMAFIIYFYAGGSFAESEIRLQVINVTFNEPKILAAIAWILHFWFFYRYWQKHSSSFLDGFENEIYNYYKKNYLSAYASKKLGQSIIKDEDEGYHIHGMVREDGKFGIKYCYASSVVRDQRTGKIISWSNRKDDDKGEIFLDDFEGHCLRFWTYTECCFRYPSFANYIVPYILFFIALCGPVYVYAF